MLLASTYGPAPLPFAHTRFAPPPHPAFYPALALYSTHPHTEQGVVLCHLGNAINPGSCKKIYEGGMPFKQMENVSMFIRFARSYLRENDLFTTVALFELKDLGAVVQTLLALKAATGGGMQRGGAVNSLESTYGGGGGGGPPARKAAPPVASYSKPGPPARKAAPPVASYSKPGAPARKTAPPVASYSSKPIAPASMTSWNNSAGLGAGKMKASGSKPQWSKPVKTSSKIVKSSSSSKPAYTTTKYSTTTYSKPVASQSKFPSYVFLARSRGEV